jgi:hypothetical protein
MRGPGRKGLVNWRYALGELALIVAGVLIALAAADWNERRLQREQELALLGEMRSGLLTDRAALETGLAQTRAAIDTLAGLKELIVSRRPYDPAADALFGSAYGFRTVSLNTAAYETLKAAGLHLVSDSRLRLGIARLFDHHYDVLDGIDQIERAVNLDLLRPYYLEHFRDIRFNESATPLDYDATIADSYFRNLVDYRATILDANQIREYAAAIAAIAPVLEQLDDVLGAAPD